MSRPSWLQKIYWTRFAKPVEDRELFKQLLSHPLSSILEIGVADGARMRRIAKLAQRSAGCEVLRYIGTDEFESAKDGKRHLSLKQAHQLAGQLGFKASLIPGDIHSAIPRVAHKLGSLGHDHHRWWVESRSTLGQRLGELAQSFGAPIFDRSGLPRTGWHTRASRSAAYRIAVADRCVTSFGCNALDANCGTMARSLIRLALAPSTIAS